MKKSKSKKKTNYQEVDEGENSDFNQKDNEEGHKNNKDGKQSNTIIQQINGFSMTPMNDRIAEQTIEDHKYLLELVENRAAIAYFAVANRNQSLFNALKNFLQEELEAKEQEV
jgi:hypothetical protein